MDDWLAGIRAQNQAALRAGVENGWWQDVIDGEPALVRKRSDFHDTALMAHAVAEMGAAPSVKQAKRNGWNKPLVAGTIRIGTRIMRIED